MYVWTKKNQISLSEPSQALSVLRGNRAFPSLCNKPTESISELPAKVGLAALVCEAGAQLGEPAGNARDAQKCQKCPAGTGPRGGEVQEPLQGLLPDATNSQ